MNSGLMQEDLPMLERTSHFVLNVLPYLIVVSCGVALVPVLLR